MYNFPLRFLHVTARSTLRSLLPELCLVCRLELLPAEQSICQLCLATLARCSTIDLQKLNALSTTLRHCQEHAPSFSACLSFAEPTKTLCYSFKYGQNARLARQLGKRIMAPKIASLLAGRDLQNRPIVLCPLPIHFNRRLARGYNQSAQLARGCAQGLKSLGCSTKVLELLEKTSHRSTQVNFDGFGRWSNAAGAYRAKKNRPLRGAIVVLVDDTVATGATMLFAAEALLQAHPETELHLVALAVDL